VTPVNGRATFNPDRHWGWFAGILCGLISVGFVGAIFAAFPLAMATDGCHGEDRDRVCALSATGQNVLVWIPWVALGVGSLAAVVGAVLAARHRRSPLIGLLVGGIAYAATVPFVYWIAFRV